MTVNYYKLFLYRSKMADGTMAEKWGMNNELQWPSTTVATGNLDVRFLSIGKSCNAVARFKHWRVEVRTLSWRGHNPNGNPLAYADASPMLSKVGSQINRFSTKMPWVLWAIPAATCYSHWSCFGRPSISTGHPGYSCSWCFLTLEVATTLPISITLVTIKESSHKQKPHYWIILGIFGRYWNMFQHGTWNQIWKLFCWGPMGQGCQDPGYGVAHSPLQLLRLQRRFGDFRTLGRSWRNHTLQPAHWLQTPRPGPTGHSAWLVTLGLSPRNRDPESGFDSSFYCGLFQSRDIFGWCRCGLLTDSLLRIRVSEKDAPAMPMPSNIDEDRCGSHEKPALLDQVPRNHAFS